MTRLRRDRQGRLWCSCECGERMNLECADDGDYHARCQDDPAHDRRGQVRKIRGGAAVFVAGSQEPAQA